MVRIEFGFDMPNQYEFLLLRRETHGLLCVGVKRDAPTAWGHVTGFGTSHLIEEAVAKACSQADQNYEMAQERKAKPVRPKGQTNKTAKELGL